MTSEKQIKEINQRVKGKTTTALLKGNPALETLLRPLLWRGGQTPQASGLSTGHPALDDALPWKGWPDKGIVQIISPRNIGELRLVLPVLSHITRERRPSIWITPPALPYAPALVQAGIVTEQVLLLPELSGKEFLWALEKALHTPDTLVLAWPDRLSIPVLRRLQLAAQTGGTLGFLFHQRAIVNAPSTLQLTVNPLPSLTGLHVQISKARGSYQRPVIQISFTGNR